MKYSSSFYYDLEFGETAEDWASEVFNSGKKIEVKFDRMACETGNIFIEYMSSGKPSGIATTQADYWIYKIDYTGAAIILDVVILKEKLRGYHARGMYLKNGGDNDTSKGFVVPIREIIKP